MSIVNNGITLDTIETGGRRYTIKQYYVTKDSPERFTVNYIALRNGQPYGPANSLRKDFPTAQECRDAIFKHAKKPYVAKGRHADNLRTRGQLDETHRDTTVIAKDVRTDDDGTRADFYRQVTTLDKDITIGVSQGEYSDSDGEAWMEACLIQVGPATKLAEGFTCAYLTDDEARQVAANLLAFLSRPRSL